MQMFKSVVLLNITCCFFIIHLFSSLTATSQNSPGPDSYTIQIDKDSPKIAFVECVLEVQDSLLFMSDTGANQFPLRWAAFIHHLEAKTLDERKIEIDTLSGAQWKIHSPNGSKVRLTYEVHLDHENYKWSGGVDGAAYARDWGVFYTGRSLFVMSNAKKENIAVNFIIPNEWKVSTPWKPSNNTGLEYIAFNQTELSDGMFFAGMHEEFIIKRGDFELVFAFGGEEILAQKKSFMDMAEGVLDYYIELMGGVPNPSPDNPFKKAIVIMNSSSITDGEVIGNNISILLEKDGDEMSQLLGRFIFAHEFFHLWNGKSFAPEGDDCEWFKEGFTNYYTLKSLFHIGYLNEQAFLKVLNEFFYKRYHNDDGVGRLSMTQGEEKHDHWGLIYCGGFFTGIAQDMIIRSSTDNEKSIDDVMRTLFKKYGGTDKGYSLEELQFFMSEASGSDQIEFFETYIKGVKRIPLADYLNLGGFIATEENGEISIVIKEDRNAKEKLMNEGLFGVK